MTGEDKPNEEYEEPAGLVFLRPDVQHVKAHLVLHVLEVLFLFVSEAVFLERGHGIVVQAVR